MSSCSIHRYVPMVLLGPKGTAFYDVDNLVQGSRGRFFQSECTQQRLQICGGIRRITPGYGLPTFVHGFSDGAGEHVRQILIFSHQDLGRVGRFNQWLRSRFLNRNRHQSARLSILRHHDEVSVGETSTYDVGAVSFDVKAEALIGQDWGV